MGQTAGAANLLRKAEPVLKLLATANSTGERLRQGCVAAEASGLARQSGNTKYLRKRKEHKVPQKLKVKMRKPRRASKKRFSISLRGNVTLEVFQAALLLALSNLSFYTALAMIYMRKRAWSGTACHVFAASHKHASDLSEVL